MVLFAGLLFSFFWNSNDNGSGSVHQKPCARKEPPGAATGGGGSRRSPQVAAALWQGEQRSGNRGTVAAVRGLL